MKLNCRECKTEFEPRQKFCCVSCKNKHSYASVKAERSAKELKVSDKADKAVTLKGTKPPVEHSKPLEVLKNAKKKGGKLVFDLKRGIYV